METTANDLDRELRHDGKTIKGAAREAARQARVAAHQEVRKLIADVEELIRRVSDAADPELARLRAKVESTVATTRKAISDGTEQVQRQAKEAFEASDRYARAQPWEAIGVAAIAGLVIGFLVGRR
jgi:ElaB protein